MAQIDHAVLAAIAGDVLAPDLVDDVIVAAHRLFDTATASDDREQCRRELATVQREQHRLTDAIAAGGELPILIERLQATERQRRALIAQLDAAQGRSRPVWRYLERRVRRSLTDWRSLLAGDVTQARTGFRQLLTTPILFTPFVEDGRRGFALKGRSASRPCWGTW